MNKYIFCILCTMFTFNLLAAEGNQPSTGGGNGGGGWRESFGGDSSVMEFKHLAKEVAYVLKTNNYTNFFGLNVSKLKNIVNESVVECGSDLILDGAPKDAINFPNSNPQKIILDCNKWRILSTSQKYRIAIHEYLPLSGINDSSYAYSEEMFHYFSKNKHSSYFAASDLVMMISHCSLERFREFTDLGGNVFIKTSTGVNLLQIAVDFSCDNIVRDLIDSGLEYVVNDELSENYSHYRIIEKALILNPDDETRLKVLNTLKSLIQKWPIIPTLGFKKLLWMVGDEYQLSPECYEGSTIMHLLGSRPYTSKDQTKFIKQLIEIGFLIDQENSCGQTARSLFKQNGIQL